MYAPCVCVYVYSSPVAAVCCWKRCTTNNCMHAQCCAACWLLRIRCVAHVVLCSMCQGVFVTSGVHAVRGVSVLRYLWLQHFLEDICTWLQHFSEDICTLGSTHAYHVSSTFEDNLLSTCTGIVQARTGGMWKCCKPWEQYATARLLLLYVLA
jgi:hypothetical protein